MDLKLNFKKALKNDYRLFLPLVVCVIGIAFFCYFTFVKKQIAPSKFASLTPPELLKTGDFYLALIYVLCTALGLAFFLKRLFYIKSFERGGRTAEGVVVDIRYVKDRCGVDVKFDFYGTPCKKHFTLMNNAQTKFVHMDSVVNLLMKDENPKHVLIADLYFDGAS